MERRPYPPDPRYSVTSDGRVFRDVGIGRAKARELKQYDSVRGYLRVCLGGHLHNVHQIVATTFLAPDENRREVAHNNGKKHDNRVENLRRANRKENSDDIDLHGNRLRGDDLRRVLSDNEVKRTYAAVSGKPPRRHPYHREVADQFGVSRECVTRIANDQGGAMQQHHAEREHAQWAASSTERNWQCPGALALTDDLPDTSSEAADWGTVAHMISEKCLRQNIDASTFLGDIEKGKKHEFEVDEEMVECAQTFIDYVRSVTGETGMLMIEQKFSLADLKPPFDAGGTADAVIFLDDEQRLEVIDLKGGRGVVVEVEGNKQLRTYALGAMLANKGLPVRTITSTIVQPRAPHKSGRIRSETYHVADLAEWAGELLKAMRRAKHASYSRSQLTDAAWSAGFLNAGNHCKFCKAAGFCPALSKKAQDAAGLWFDDLDQPRLANSPDAMSPEALAAALDAADMIEGWISATRAFAHAQAESGATIPNYMLVDKIGRRKWATGDENEIVTKMRSLGVDDPFTRKVVSPAQAEKLLGTKRKKEISDLIVTPVNGTNLVRADKTVRKAATPPAQRYFEAT